METIRLLLADDHAPFREGLRALLRSEADMELVGETATGEEAIRLAAALQPDVILMDLHMPTVNGITATQTILATSPHISILVLTMFEDDDSVFGPASRCARLSPQRCAQGGDRASHSGSQPRRSHLWTHYRQAVDVLLRHAAPSDTRAARPGVP